MTIVVCLFGALTGFIVVLVAGRLALPFVLRSQAARTTNGQLDAAGMPVPGFLRDAERVRRLTLFVYRFVLPVPFAAVGAFAAYQISLWA